MRFNRREFLAAGAALAGRAAEPPIRIAGREVEIQISQVGRNTVRLTAIPLKDDRGTPIPEDGSLVRTSWRAPVARLRTARAHSVERGTLRVEFAPDPLSFTIRGETLERLRVDPATGAVLFPTGGSPLLGLGEGGPQFDRRGSRDSMRSGQGGFELRTHGARVPIPWLIGTEGWALFVHQPFGAFDFTGEESRFEPPTPAAALPLDLFFVSSRDPAVIMSEYARLTGYAELPALWTFGYQQSHRTLSSRAGILEEARTFREKKLPCDTMIYLGTGFCPSGWNTGNGEWSFNTKVFPDPKEMFAELHSENFKVVLHTVIRARSMRGTVRDQCDPNRPAEEQPSCYWKLHEPVFEQGVDGWWPDEGDPLDIASRLVRNRMYWEAPQLDRPNERPFALHRNGYAGMQRYASFLWSGDVYSTWETLKVHVPIAINTALTGIPYWGTDIGGFVPTRELTAELYVRWFQFAAFNTLFRAHGRNWKLRLPWGWNAGDPGPNEIGNQNGAALPDASQLHNASVEPICRKYLDLRYRLLPYLYSAVRECTRTGMPVIRAMWLHYPRDPLAVARGDQYLFGPDVMVAPVVEPGAAERSLYLPAGSWYDFWTGERHEGAREIVRKVDLETIPIYIRAGAVLPLGPVKQFTGEKVDEPLELRIYPGAPGSMLLYEDDGESFHYRRGEWMGIEAGWNDEQRLLTLRLSPGSRMLPPFERRITVRAGDSVRPVLFTGRLLEVRC